MLSLVVTKYQTDKITILQKEQSHLDTYVFTIAYGRAAGCIYNVEYLRNTTSVPPRSTTMKIYLLFLAAFVATALARPSEKVKIRAIGYTISY